MAFSRTWNSAYEAIPADTDQISEGALRIRNHKVDIRERMEEGGVDWDTNGLVAAAFTTETTIDVDNDFVLYWDASASAFRKSTIANLRNNIGSPIGSIADYTGTSAPTGWLLAFGQEVSRTTYAALFAVTGTTFGVGDGSTTFNLPDLRGRVTAGQDDMGGTSADRLTGSISGLDGDTFAATGGVEHHQLTITEMPAHNHDWGKSTAILAGGGGVSGEKTAGSPQTTATTNTGGNTAHTNIQPTIILNKMIFAGV